MVERRKWCEGGREGGREGKSGEVKSYTNAKLRFNTHDCASILAEASATEHHVVLANQTMVVATLAAARERRGRREGVGKDVS
jgi:hypothetical protein